MFWWDSRRPRVQWSRSFLSFTSGQTLLQNQLRGRYPAVKLELTGEIPLNFDIRKASADDVQRGESLVIPATLALLLVAFGSLVAALIPLAVGQLAIATTLAITGFLAQRWHLSILVQNLATMLGLGLGIDYALLMVSRFREAISAGHDGPAASVIAARQAGRTLLISASTVAIGFLALLTVPISEIRSIGVAGFLVAGISVLLTNTLVPAVLALLGPRIDAGRMPFTPRLDAHRAARTGNRWRKWGKVIVAHPWLALFLAGAPLLLLAWQATRLDTSRPQRGLASASRRNRSMRCTPWNKWIGPALFIRCASLSNCQRIPLRKPTRDGMRSIVSPSGSRATLVAPASFPSQRLRRATGFPH